MALSTAYNVFAGDKDMDSRTFLKLCKDCNLLDKNLTQTDCDLIFTKVKSKGAKRITYNQFEAAIDEVAARKKVSTESVIEKIAASQGPVYAGTVADAVRLHDDKSTYTGVHQHGGPSTVDKPNTKFNSTFSTYGPSQGGGGNAITLDQICDRSTPDVRGVNKSFQRG